jgi:transcriptional regulator of acetoin/glycerol metabolism
MQRAAVVANDGVIRPEDLPARILTPKDEEPASRAGTEVRDNPLLDDLEKRTIEEALHRARGNLSEAARGLGVVRATLYRKLKKYGLPH